MKRDALKCLQTPKKGGRRQKGSQLEDLASCVDAFSEANEGWGPLKEIQKKVLNRDFLKDLFFKDILNKTTTFGCLGGRQGGGFRMLEHSIEEKAGGFLQPCEAGRFEMFANAKKGWQTAKS